MTAWLRGALFGSLALIAFGAAAQVKPRASEIMPRASQSLTLAVVNNGKHLITVGDRGQILASNDGLKWAQVEVPVRSTLTAVAFVDDQTGWAVGFDATILKTEDGGKSWMLQNFEPEKETAFLSVAATDRHHAYAVGAFGLFYATSDGGISWAEVAAPAVRDEELSFHSIVRLNDGSLFIAGESGMLGLSSGGKWQRLKSPYEGTFFGALPRGKKGALIFGLGGTIYVSDDVRSMRWSKLALGTEAALYGGTLLPDGRVLLVGLSGAVWVVDADGKRARPIASGVAFSLCGVAAVNGGLVVVGESGVQRFNTSL
ncbi:MAG: hypothetical protein JWQ90_4844 [Hydrocarboniphaga sp.]|uniref:YCF48-related protein n=1 Tax=Hydrocarboniphaga sp. TaxID=2033016 RepID=UPI0026264EE5|nr:YCF48-related protein [Hydrocarboniphaga sp.]MDB5972394.1 hypothetical protein [Hydrocarboniphaga sp.]